MKNARHEQILKLIREHDIETQEELAARLNECGFAVTQATVSRDIRQLELRKVPAGNGRQKYAKYPHSSPRDAASRYRDVLRASYVSMDTSLNILVLHTVSGMAMAAAAALDSLGWEEILGCIAGDDTIFAVMRRPEDREGVAEKLRSLTEGKMDQC
ncbi:MAG: arginine repressor [Lachnospiraceae bacterium]|nr:arginine repressor [Lachnospiraceae bacterium]